MCIVYVSTKLPGIYSVGVVDLKTIDHYNIIQAQTFCDGLHSLLWPEVLDPKDP